MRLAPMAPPDEAAGLLPQLPRPHPPAAAAIPSPGRRAPADSAATPTKESSSRPLPGTPTASPGTNALFEKEDEVADDGVLTAKDALRALSSLDGIVPPSLAHSDGAAQRMLLLMRSGCRSGDSVDFSTFCEFLGFISVEHQKADLKKHFKALAKANKSSDSLVRWDTLVAWIRTEKQSMRREARKMARTLFEMADDDNSGFLDQAEVGRLHKRLVKEFPAINVSFDPPFNLDADFSQMDKDGAGRVSWEEFETWWIERSGDPEPCCPVLPEGMVSKIQHAVPRNATGWDFLRPRLKLMVSLQKWWGAIHDLSSGGSESLYAKEVLPPFIRGPDSVFTMWWDFFQVLFITWVAVVVPLRMGFDKTIGIDEWQFWVDVLIDTFFVVDICLNVRTAYWLPTGFLEVDPSKILSNYLRSWFFIDLVASLPLSYLALVMHVLAEGEDSSGGGLRLAKSLRIVRMAKMLRVARLKRIIGRYGSLVEFTAYMNSMFTFILILYTAHVLCCAWYWVGDQPGGWVHNLGLGGHGGSKNVTGTEQYSVSLYTIFKLGDAFALEESEQWFAFLSELVISVIYGALAGVMSTLMMAGAVGEQEYLVKLAQLKAWMKAKHLPMHERTAIMAFFSANHQSAAYFDEQAILGFLPLSVSRDLSMHLYSTVLNETPMFNNLTDGLMLSLCQAIRPQTFQEGQLCYKEGQVGTEMYFVLKGEMEVSCHNERLGFIGQGGFFGENCIIEAVRRKGGVGGEVRIRTVKATTVTDLAMLTTQATLDLCDNFPELEIRLQSFRKAGLSLSRKGAHMQTAKRLRDESVGPNRARVLVARAGLAGSRSFKWGSYGQDGQDLSYSEGMACSVARGGATVDATVVDVVQGASDEANALGISGGSGAHLVLEDAAQQLLGLCRGDAMQAMEVLLKMAKTDAS